MVTHGATYVGYGYEWMFVGADRNGARQITVFFLMALNLDSGDGVRLVRTRLTEFEAQVTAGELKESDDVAIDINHNMALILKYFHRCPSIRSVPVWASLQHHVSKVGRDGL